MEPCVQLSTWYEMPFFIGNSKVNFISSWDELSTSPLVKF